MERRLSSLDEMTASELNAAVDTTNFPKTTNSAASTPLDPNVVSQALGLGTAAVPETNSNTADDEAAAQNDSVENELSDRLASIGTASGVVNTNGAAKGIIRREHPTPLRMVSFRDDRVDLPGTPRTPRTSTTPGNFGHDAGEFG